MAECSRVPSRLTDAALEAGPMIERFYLRGGGSSDDLRTDMSYVIEAVLDTLVGSTPPPPPRTRRRGRSWLRAISSPGYVGPDRRRPEA